MYKNKKDTTRRSEGSMTYILKGIGVIVLIMFPFPLFLFEICFKLPIWGLVWFWRVL